MARKLLFCKGMRTLLLIPAFGGCLFLTPIEEGEGPNQEENFAPVADIESIFPLLTTPKVSMVQPEIVSFRIPTIVDPNIDDTITVRFFADGQNEFIDQRILNDSGDFIRTGVLDFVLSESQLVAFQDDNGNLSGRHRLEVIISDRGFASDSGEGARQIKDGGKQSYYSWELEFSNECQ